MEAPYFVLAENIVKLWKVWKLRCHVFHAKTRRCVCFLQRTVQAGKEQVQPQQNATIKKCWACFVLQGGGQQATCVKKAINEKTYFFPDKFGIHFGFSILKKNLVKMIHFTQYKRLW